MADYWKSLPKKYCEFCKCWITDNKAIQKNQTTVEKERQQYYNEMLKIESAALSSFQADISKNPSLASELKSNKSIISKLKNEPNNETKTNASTNANRFGESYDCFESEKLVNGKKRALETISKSFEKKSRWLEVETSDGKYYYNKETLETRKDPPKSGFLSLAEQKQIKNLSNQAECSTSNDAGSSVFRVDPYGGWRKVEENDIDKMIDLQLPNQNNFKIVMEYEKTKHTTSEKQNSDNDDQFKVEEKKSTTIDFRERTVESLGQKKTMFSSRNADQSMTFKKRSKSNLKNLRSNFSND
ncbi:hypothetical protein QR98_0105050 [Sarcoptes scabiei]|uniref:U1-C C2H2-type zinc finger domain-containing protein n=1 Tax=Sarcoptes scabiei TaxID=52283 RepID=A0A132ALS4_SARSC|nr:hypothetical protein QR98_0105050 [Sarcoptes scabiei]